METPAQVLFEDDSLVVVLKPPGVTVVPARNEPGDASLQARLQASRGERLWVVHRLDRDTSGAIVLARTERAHRSLSMAFEHRETDKAYLAWTRGRPAESSGRIDTPLHPARKGRMRPAHPGEQGALVSETDWTLLGAWLTDAGPVACVEARPHTGRQHQIRVHLRSIETPLVVDPIYGRTERLDPDALGLGSPALSRLSLHAHRLAFPHPSTGQRVQVDAPLPADLSALDAWLRSRPAA